MNSFRTESSLQTYNVGKALAGLLTAGDVICLSGDLGAGKTLFTQGIAAGLGIAEEVTSPTFTVMQIYDAEVPLYHFDLYRLEHQDELLDIGFYEYIDSDGITVIEWPDKFIDCLPEQYLWITINKGDNDNHRVIELKPAGSRYQKLCKGLSQFADTGPGYNKSGM